MKSVHFLTDAEIKTSLSKGSWSQNEKGQSLESLRESIKVFMHFNFCQFYISFNRTLNGKVYLLNLFHMELV